jgi:protoporphyrinogen oxidase
MYRKSDAELVAQTWQSIRHVAPALQDRDLIATHVARTPFAQAICPTNFLSMVPDIETPIPGLWLLDSVLLYPEDRTQSGSILKAYQCAREIEARAG